MKDRCILENFKIRFISYIRHLEICSDAVLMSALIRGLKVNQLLQVLRAEVMNKTHKYYASGLIHRSIRVCGAENLILIVLKWRNAAI